MAKRTTREIAICDNCGMVYPVWKRPNGEVFRMGNQRKECKCRDGKLQVHDDDTGEMSDAELEKFQRSG